MMRTKNGYLNVEEYVTAFGILGGIFLLPFKILLTELRPNKTTLKHIQSE